MSSHCMMRRIQWPVVSIAIAAMLGCQQAPPPSPSAAPPTDSTAPSADKVSLIRGDAKALDELIARHQGQVVLVDYWATWCGPCVENFPHTVALAKKYRSQGLATIAVNFDFLD